MRVYLLILLLAGFIEARKQLSTPRKVSAKVASPHSIDVKWRDPDLRGRGRTKVKATRLYILRYQAEVDEDSENGDYKIVKSRVRKVKLVGLQENTTYSISVKVVKNKRSSGWSKAIKVTTDAETEKSNVVRNLTATPVASDAILLSWLPPSQANEVVAYTVLAQLANGKGRQRKAVVNNEMSSYEVKNLRPYLTYSFRVQTMQNLGSHPVSVAVQAKPFSDVPSSHPRDLRLEMINSSLVVVQWQPPSPRSRNGQIVGYRLQYKRKGSRKGDVCTITTERGVRVYRLTDILGNETYKIRVAASTVNGTGPYTKWQSVFVEPSNETEVVERKYYKSDTISSDGIIPDLSPSPPSEVKLVNKSGSSVHLIWPVPVTPECCPVVAYRIVIRNYNDSTDSEIVRGTAHLHLTGLDPDTLYGVSVSTLNTAGESVLSKELQFISPEAVPPTMVFYQATTVHLAGDANLTCKARGHEVPNIEWYIALGKGEEDASLVRISESTPGLAEIIKLTSHLETHDLKTSSLLLYKVTSSAEKRYVCVAKNSAGVIKRGLQLYVNEPPRILIHRGMTVMVNTPARLVCGAYGNPIPDIIWVHTATGTTYNESPGNDKENIYATSVSDKSNHVRQSFLVIGKSSLLHGGGYSCIAKSQAGRATETIFLDVKVPPPPPVYKIQAIALSPTRVSVNWLPPLNYTYGIRFYQVSYRKRQGGQALIFNVTRVGTELDDLEHATDYLVGVTAGTEDSLGESGPEVPITTLTNEGLEPANVSAKTINSSIIQLDWEAPNDISPMYIRGYNVYYKREGDERVEKLFVQGSRNKQFLIGLGRDDTYYLRISTVMTWGYEAPSAWIRIHKRSETYLPPAKPMNVTADAKHEEIILKWNQPFAGQVGLPSPSTQVKGYRIVYGPITDPVNVSRAVADADVKAFKINGLRSGTEYMISIRAFNDVGDGDPVYVRTVTQVYPPSMVQRAKAHAVSSTEIHVQWEPPKRGLVTRYHIRYWRPGRKDKQSAWMTGNFRNYVAGSLRKNSNYRFEIIPYNGELLGEGIVIFAQTYGDKPDGPPKDVSIRPVNSTALLASWSPPDPERANGHIIGYKLILRTKGGPRMASFRVPGTMTNYTFLDMEISKTYKFRIAAITVNGTGVFSPWTESTFSANPDKPDPPEELSITATETSLTLQWERPRFTGSPVHGYVIGYGQFIPEVYRHIISDSELTYTIKSLKPDSEYIISVRAFNHIGESLPTFKLARTKEVSVLATPLLAPVKLTVQSESPTSLTLSWIDPALTDTQKILDGRAYMVRFSPSSGQAYSFVNTSDLHFYLSDLVPATLYEVSVKVVRGSGSSSWSLPVVNSTLQIAPSSAPENIAVLPLPRHPTHVYLNWTEPRHPNGKIEEYIIYFTSDPALDTKFWVVLTTDKQELKIKDITPRITYYFRLQARNRAGHGPLSDIVTYSPPSGKTEAPSNVTVTGLYGNMSTTVRVTWDVPQVSQGLQITGYVVYYTDNMADDAEWLVQTERGQDTVIMSLEYNTTYYFKVRARYAGVYGPYSDVVKYTTSIPPTQGLKPQTENKTESDGKDNLKRGSFKIKDYTDDGRLDKSSTKIRDNVKSGNLDKDGKKIKNKAKHGKSDKDNVKDGDSFSNDEIIKKMKASELNKSGAEASADDLDEGGYELNNSSAESIKDNDYNTCINGNNITNTDNYYDVVRYDTDNSDNHDDGYLNRSNSDRNDHADDKFDDLLAIDKSFDNLDVVQEGVNERDVVEESDKIHSDNDVDDDDDDDDDNNDDDDGTDIDDDDDTNDDDDTGDDDYFDEYDDEELRSMAILYNSDGAFKDAVNDTEDLLSINASLTGRYENNDENDYDTDDYDDELDDYDEEDYYDDDEEDEDEGEDDGDDIDYSDYQEETEEIDYDTGDDGDYDPKSQGDISVEKGELNDNNKQMNKVVDKEDKSKL